MKKALATVIMILSAVATAAPKLHAVRVTAEDFRPGMALELVALDRANETFSRRVAAQRMTFRVPAGNYAVSILQTPESSAQNRFAEPVSLRLVVKGKMDVRLKASYLPEIPVSDLTVTQRLTISTSAEPVPCEEPAVNVTCVSSPLPFHVIEPLTRLTDGLRLLNSWEPFSNDGYRATFEINGRKYNLTVERDGSGSLMTWQRL